MFALRWIANSSHLSNHAQSMRRRAETQMLCTGSAGRQCKVQEVAALVIRDAVGDAISRQQAAVKPGPWPGRRAAGEALSRGLASSHLASPRGATVVRLPPLTWAPFTSGGLRQVYLYLRPHTPALPLPGTPLRTRPSGPIASLTSQCLDPPPPPTRHSATGRRAARQRQRRCGSGRQRHPPRHPAPGPDPPRPPEPDEAPPISPALC